MSRYLCKAAGIMKKQGHLIPPKDHGKLYVSDCKEMAIPELPGRVQNNCSQDAQKATRKCKQRYEIRKNKTGTIKNLEQHSEAKTENAHSKGFWGDWLSWDVWRQKESVKKGSNYPSQPRGGCHPGQSQKQSTKVVARGQGNGGKEGILIKGYKRPVLSSGNVRYGMAIIVHNTALYTWTMLRLEL